MKRLILAFVTLAVLLISYWVWPFIGLRSLAADLQTRDAAALTRDVDFGRTGQIITAYLRITGREKKLGPLAQAVGASIIDPWLAQIVTPEKLAELLRGGTVSSELGPLFSTLVKFRSSL
jgi:hypothetical protein